jgi:hypothetical protein
VCRIRIRIDFGRLDPLEMRTRIRIQEGKNDPQKYKKGRNFKFLNAECFLLRAEDFSCSLDVLYGGLGKCKVQFLIQKTKQKFQL